MLGKPFPCSGPAAVNPCLGGPVELRCLGVGLPSREEHSPTLNNRPTRPESGRTSGR